MSFSLYLSALLTPPKRRILEKDIFYFTKPPTKSYLQGDVTLLIISPPQKLLFSLKRIVFPAIYQVKYKKYTFIYR